MSNFKTIAGNTAFLSFAQIANPLTSILLVSLIARLIGAEALGAYSLVLALFYMAVNMAGLGLAVPITRALAIHPEKSAGYFSATSVIAIVTGTLAVGGLHALVRLLDYPDAVVDATATLAWAVVPSVLLLYLEAIFMATKRVVFVALASLVENSLKVAIGLALLMLDFSIASVFLVIALLRIGALLIYIIAFARGGAPLSLSLDREIFKELKRVSPVFSANVLLGASLGRVDILILSKLASLTDVGYYSAALRFITIARLVPRSFKRVALPAMSEDFGNKTTATTDVFNRGVLYMAVFGCGAALTIFVLADLLIRLLYGDGFAAANAPLRVMAFILIPVSLCNVLGTALLASHRETLDLWSNVVRIAFLCVACVALFPLFGMLGVAAALVCSQLVLLALQRYFVGKYCFSPSMLKRAGPPIAAALITLATCLTLAQFAFSLAAVAALALYPALVMSFDATVRRDVTATFRRLPHSPPAA